MNRKKWKGNLLTVEPISKKNKQERRKKTLKRKNLSFTLSNFFSPIVNEDKYTEWQMSYPPPHLHVLLEIKNWKMWSPLHTPHPRHQKKSLKVCRNAGAEAVTWLKQNLKQNSNSSLLNWRYWDGQVCMKVSVQLGGDIYIHWPSLFIKLIHCTILNYQLEINSLPLMVIFEESLALISMDWRLIVYDY